MTGPSSDIRVDLSSKSLLYSFLLLTCALLLVNEHGTGICFCRYSSEINFFLGHNNVGVGGDLNLHIQGNVRYAHIDIQKLLFNAIVC